MAAEGLAGNNRVRRDPRIDLRQAVYGLRSSSGSLAKLTASRGASCLLTGISRPCNFTRALTLV